MVVSFNTIVGDIAHLYVRDEVGGRAWDEPHPIQSTSGTSFAARDVVSQAKCPVLTVLGCSKNRLALRCFGARL